MRTQTATQAGEFTAAMLHYGPGPHPDGTPQAVHGGGGGQQGLPDTGIGQMGFEFEAKPAPTPVVGPVVTKPDGYRPNGKRTNEYMVRRGPRGWQFMVWLPHLKGETGGMNVAVKGDNFDTADAAETRMRQAAAEMHLRLRNKSAE